MNDLLAAFITEIEIKIKLQGLLQNAHVKPMGEEDPYIKGITNGLEKALVMARDLAYLYETEKRGEL